MISLVIPTYNERENIEKLIPEIFRVFGKSGLEGEVVIVDDNSPDGTTAAAEKFSEKYNVRVLCREEKLGLSSAVLDGFIVSRGEILGVMDADFSHPVEKIPELVAQLKDSDMAIGSRKVPGGSIDSWPLRRRILSKAASLFARPLTSISDPMSGFFFINRSILDDAELNPKGFKIGLEIAVRCRPIVKEVPIRFRDRMHGESKMDRGVMCNYFRHLKGLYLHRARQRLRLVRGCRPGKPY